MSVGVEICVWEARPGESEAFWRSLSPDEKERADKFFRAVDRERWIVSRGQVRHLLGAATGIEAGAVRFEVEPNGRPYLAGRSSEGPFFNLSHSEHVGILALSSEVRVGADVEAVRQIEDGEIAWALSPAERALLDSVPSHDRLESFFRFWTLKEAFMKGTGLGASLPLHDFDMDLDGPSLKRLAGLPDEPVRWRFAEGVPAAGMRAAIAVRSEAQDIAVTWRHID